MRVAVTAALVAVLALAAGCGDDEAETTEATTTPAAAGPTGAEVEQVAPPQEVQDKRDRSGDDSGATGGDPRGALKSFFTSGDPDVVCGELVTENLLSTAYGDEKGCRQAQVPAAVPDSIEVRSLQVSGEEAQAVVIPDGGPNDGIETEVTLVDEGGAWRVDSLEADVPAGP